VFNATRALNGILPSPYAWAHKNRVCKRLSPPTGFIMSKPTVYVLDPYHFDATSLMQSTDWIQVILPDDPRRVDWHDNADGVIIRSETRLTALDFDMAKKLKVVVKQGVGVDNIDLEAARKAGIAVHNTPALNSETVAEYALAMTMSMARRVPELDRQIRAGQKLVRSQMLGLSLHQKMVGVVGMGNIGKLVAKKFIGACEARVIGYDPVAPPDAWSDVEHVRASSLQELLRASDVVTLHVPLLDSTRGMIGRKEMDSMKDTAILVNTSRGGIVEEAALLDTLKGGKLWGAVLDAMEVEPPTKEVYGEFLRLDNVIITPHVGAGTRENQSNSGLAVVRTLLAVLQGEPHAPGKLV